MTAPEPVDDAGAVDDAAGAERPRRSWGGPAVAAVVVFVVIGLLVVVLATREPAANRLATSTRLGLPAPAVAGATLDGGTYDLGDERGRWVLVNFFATWCAPCRAEHDDLVEFAQRHAAAGDASVVSVVWEDSLRDAQAFFAENGGGWPVIISDDGGIGLDYGVTGVPESYLVDPSGVVIARVLGGVTAEGLESILARARAGTL